MLPLCLPPSNSLVRIDWGRLGHDPVLDCLSLAALFHRKSQTRGLNKTVDVSLACSEPQKPGPHPLLHVLGQVVEEEVRDLHNQPFC